MKFALPQKLIFSLFFLLILIFIIIGAILYPTIKNIYILDKDIHYIQQDLEQKYDLSQKLRRSLQEMKQAETDAKKFSQAYIQQGQELSLITDLETLAENNNIKQELNLELIDTSQQKIAVKDKPAMPQYYRLTFTNYGSFADHFSYLQSLEKFPYYFIIDTINLEKKKGKETEAKNPELKLTFQAHVYVEKK